MVNIKSSPQSRMHQNVSVLR